MNMYYRSSTQLPKEMDTATYDVIDNKSCNYEIINKGKGGKLKAPSTNKEEKSGYTLSKCPAYGPVSTPTSQVVGYSAEYEAIEATSHL